VDALFTKSPYSSVEMAIYFDIINLVENYMVVNEVKSPYEINHSKQFLLYMFKTLKLKSTQK
jgi:hypothetical protein